MMSWWQTAAGGGVSWSKSSTILGEIWRPGEMTLCFAQCTRHSNCALRPQIYIKQILIVHNCCLHQICVNRIPIVAFIKHISSSPSSRIASKARVPGEKTYFLWSFTIPGVGGWFSFRLLWNKYRSISHPCLARVCQANFHSSFSQINVDQTRAPA